MEVAMTTLMITLPDDQLTKLQEVAARFDISPEELARLGVEELLIRPDEVFERALTYVLTKNTELHRRLD
jgi:hypothetical protein